MDRPSSTLRKQRKPSFFKILIKDFPSGLQFSPAFTKKFGEQIPNTTKLEVKDYHEKSWEVEVEKIGKIHCFRKGWREFVKENNLEPLDFLVFKYLADLKSFKVTIFGRTGCVKEFPVSRDRNSELLNGNSPRIVQDGEKTKIVQEDDKGDKAYERDVICIDSDDEDMGTLKQTMCKGKTKEHCIKDGGKRERVQVDDDDANTDQMMKGERMNKSKFEGDKSCGDVIHIDSKDEKIGTLKQTVCKGKTKDYCIEDKKTLKKKRKCNSGEDQIKFNSRNPFFKVELTQTNISGGYRHIPMWFVMEHLSMKKEKVARIHICKESWPMRIYLIKNRRKMGTREARISLGWGKFVKDKGLQMQDMCIFEMMKNNDRNVVFHVHVYRKFGENDEFVKIW